MKHTMSVLVQVDLDGTYVHILVTGCLTAANQHVLHPVIGRARALTPEVHVEVDLDSVRHLEPTAVTSLRAAIDREEIFPGRGEVTIAVPSGSRAHPPVRALPLGAPEETWSLPALAA
ncbi:MULTISPECIES: hypothetical protein [Kocuria]|jgi:hypothetical protein|uniref:hypothetical protein n=1 Tax=Kocuria TaxID=57493 RepID=UPI00203E10D2|nr:MULTISPECIES: hypothetical protein [Kocuria]MCM3688403.1 hypothetical protein [Kocuria rosea]HST71323.1 hypothetical protein [Kocuria rosea]